MSWRARAVFVSGTFRDMHEERDFLEAQAFHAFGEELAKHYTIVERVDLRVGVETRGLGNDHAKQEQVLKVCLEDIRRCRPFLIVLIGDRYGWVPPIDRARAAAKEAKFDTALEGKSVTALEIEFGLLADRDQQTRSRIYFRKLDYAGMDETDAILYSDARAAASALVSAEEQVLATKRAAALTALTRTLHEDPVLGPRCRDYPATWNPVSKKVTGLGEFVAQVIKDLLPEMIAEADEQVAAAKAGTLPTALEQFVAERSRGFRGRADLVQRLCTHASNPADADVRGLVLAGPSGGGKSAVFARVYEELAGSSEDDLWLLPHAAGIHPRSTSVATLLEDWVAVLAGKLGVENPLVVPIDELRTPESRMTAGMDQRPKPEEAFADLLARAAAKRRVVLLIDALDRFERTLQAEQLTWLPAPLPANVGLVATAIPGPETEALAHRPDFVVEPLDALTLHEARLIAESVYGRYHREVNDDAVGVLIDKLGPDGTPAHGNALWLVSALEELNLLDGDDFRRAEAGTGGTDEDRLHALVVGEARAMPGDVERLYARIFERAGRRVSDDPREGRALARAFTTAIALSRGGFRERDLAALMPDIARLLDPSAPSLTWNALAFASLRRALRGHLVRRGDDDRWDFHHRQARSAAEHAYVRGAGIQKRIHAVAAKHLLDLPADDPLRESEAMHHLIQADARKKAARLYAGELTPGALAGCQETLAKYALGEQGLAWVTSLLEIKTLEPIVLVALGERYLFDLDAVLNRMYVILPRAGIAQATERLFRRLLNASPGHSGLLRDVSVSLEHVGAVETARGNLEGGVAAYAESLTIRRGLADGAWPDLLREVSNSLTNVAWVQLMRGNLEGASAACAESLQIARRLLDPARPDSLLDLFISLDHVGELELERGNLEGASAAYAESLTIARRLSDPARPDSLRTVSLSLNHVGEVEKARGNLEGASAAYAESLTIARRLSDPARPNSLRDVSASLNNVGWVQLTRGNLEDASAAYVECLQIARRLSDAARPDSLRDVSISLDNVGRFEWACGNLEGASAAYAESLTIRRRVSDPTRPDSLRDVSVSLGHVGDVELKRGNLEGAAAAYVESLTIVRRLSDAARPASLRDVSLSLDSVGLVEMARGNLDEARQHLEESLKVLTDLERDGKLRPAWGNDIAWVKEQLRLLSE